MCIVYGLYLSSWLRLYFKDCGGPLCKEPILPPLPRIFSVFFPCISLTFTKTECMVLPFLLFNHNGCNPHNLALCLGEKTPNTERKVRCIFPVIIDEICILVNKKQRCKKLLHQKKTAEASLLSIAPICSFYRERRP